MQLVHCENLYSKYNTYVTSNFSPVFVVWGRYPHYIHTGYPNGLNPNVTVGRNSVGIAAPGDSGP
jgi:hypothetical protein